MPHIKDRPLVMQRFPDGIEAEGFFQKNMPDFLPDWIGAVEVDLRQGGKQQLVLANKAADLVYIANSGTITLHNWLTKTSDLEKPDRLIFDLDPHGRGFTKVKETALKLRDMLADRGLAPYVMTTGSKGLHIVVPIVAKYSFDNVREFAKAMAEELVQQNPRELTIADRKAERGTRIFLDYLRNAYGQTAVAPYSVRALPAALVATPLDWEELDGLKNSQKYSIKNIFRRLAAKDDPWKNIDADATELPL
jgi:bifunctional non-homologous end joining protein LigD